MLERFNLIDTSELEAQIHDLKGDVDSLKDRVTGVEETVYGVAGPAPAPSLGSMTEVNVRHGLNCGPDDDVAAAIAEHVAERAPEDRNHTYVLPGDAAWYWNSEIDPGSYRGFAVVGEPHARVRLGPDVDLMTRLSGERHALANLTIDVTGEDVDAGISRVSTGVQGEFRNLLLVGQRDRYGLEGDRFCLRVDATDEQATNVVENVLLPDGDVFYSDESSVGHAIPMSSEQGHVGTNHWRGCYVEGFTDNAYYLKGGPGANHIRSCIATNNAGPLIRLGRNDSARHCHIVQDDPPGAWTGFWAQEGGPVFERCSAHVTAPKTNEILRDTSDGATRWSDILIADRSPSKARACRFAGTGRTTVERLTIADRTDPDGGDYMVYVQHGNTHFEGCTFENNSRGARHGVLAYTDAINRVSFEDCTWTGREHVAIRLRDHAVDWEGRFNRFKPNARILIDDGVQASEWTWIGNRHTGEDAIGDRATGWKGRGTNHNFTFPEPAGN